MADFIVRRAYATPAPDKTGKKQGNRGQFQPGQSGNPKGRPQGSRNKATLTALELLAEDLEAITRKGVEKAKVGDMVAIRLVLDKLIPSGWSGTLASMSGRCRTGRRPHGKKAVRPIILCPAFHKTQGECHDQEQCLLWIEPSGYG